MELLLTWPADLLPLPLAKRRWLLHCRLPYIVDAPYTIVNAAFSDQ
jgi:hypothetical protein